MVANGPPIQTNIEPDQTDSLKSGNKVDQVGLKLNKAGFWFINLKAYLSASVMHLSLFSGEFYAFESNFAPEFSKADL